MMNGDLVEGELERNVHTRQRRLHAIHGEFDEEAEPIRGRFADSQPGMSPVEATFLVLARSGWECR